MTQLYGMHNPYQSEGIAKTMLNVSKDMAVSNADWFEKAFMNILKVIL